MLLGVRNVIFEAPLEQNTDINFHYIIVFQIMTNLFELELPPPLPANTMDCHLPHV